MLGAPLNEIVLAAESLPRLASTTLCVRQNVIRDLSSNFVDSLARQIKGYFSR